MSALFLVINITISLSLKFNIAIFYVTLQTNIPDAFRIRFCPIFYLYFSTEGFDALHKIKCCHSAAALAAYTRRKYDFFFSSLSIAVQITRVSLLLFFSLSVSFPSHLQPNKRQSFPVWESGHLCDSV